MLMLLHYIFDETEYIYVLCFYITISFEFIAMKWKKIKKHVVSSSPN